MQEKPFHYGSHYSNIGSVLHFLVRLEPYAQYFIEFQGEFQALMPTDLIQAGDLMCLTERSIA
jgi:hypothetical protein